MPLTPEAVAEISRLVEESSRKGDFLVRNVQQIFAVLKRHSLLQRHCGGADAFFLAETEMFLRSHGQSKGMGPSFWENVSADLKKGDQVTFFRHALVKLALSTNLVTATSVKKALAKDALPKAIKADEAMSKIRSMLTGAGVQLMSEIGTGTALHILKVKQADEEEHAPKAKKAKTTKK
ncbi:unnamed protein product [Symbiodinium sp. CCMP2592]|nr:unnamed protein product [Symbiodinium sp. CCMP2592]